MKGEILKIIFKEDNAFLTEEVALDFSQVPISALRVKFQASAFWTIRVINYIENENRLFVEVLSYQVGETHFPTNQIELNDVLLLIDKITFKSIDTTGLLRTLNSKQPVNILPPKPEKVYRQEVQIQPIREIEREPLREIASEPLKQIYNEPFSIPIKNVTFISGGVEFEKKIPQFKQPIKFKILNESIIAEYDAIKNYFANVLKTKNIQVEPTILIVDDLISSISATSAEIEKIDNTFIEEVKYEFINAARRKEPSSHTQLFTVDEYLDTYGGNDSTKKTLFKDDNEFFENLLTKSETKHYKHLRFLSSKHNYEIQKLRLIHRPFSFIFLLSGINTFHIIWETLDTQEATYVWRYSNNLIDLNKVLLDITETINTIIKDGKNYYLSQGNENFTRIFHDYTDLQNGFKSWKEEIEKVVL